MGAPISLPGHTLTPDAGTTEMVWVNPGFSESMGLGLTADLLGSGKV